MKPLWAIQKALISDSDSMGMREALDRNGIPYQLIDVQPFSDNIPVVDYKGPVIPYGGTKFIDKLKNLPNWVCFFNDNFRYHIYLEKYGTHMFNSDGKYMKMKDFSPSMYKKGEYLFIRPDKDIKEFAGNTTKPEDFMGWYKKIKNTGWDVNEQTEIIVATASKIHNEWRTYVVDGQVISGSRYRYDHYLSMSADVPERVYDYVREMIKIWQPAPVFVMDICDVNGDLKILELGDLHSCGWYESDKEKVLVAVTDYVERNYN
jgi:hypothetical protein